MRALNALTEIYDNKHQSPNRTKRNKHHSTQNRQHEPLTNDVDGSTTLSSVALSQMRSSSDPQCVRGHKYMYVYIYVTRVRRGGGGGVNTYIHKINMRQKLLHVCLAHVHSMNKQ